MYDMESQLCIPLKMLPLHSNSDVTGGYVLDGMGTWQDWFFLLSAHQVRRKHMEAS